MALASQAAGRLSLTRGMPFAEDAETLPSWDEGAPCGCCSFWLLCDPPCCAAGPPTKAELLATPRESVGGSPASSSAPVSHPPSRRCGERCRTQSGHTAVFHSESPDPWVRHRALGPVPLSQALQAEGWVMFDAWDSVSVVATSLFLPTAITDLSKAAGSSAPKALWSFLSSIATWVSLVAFITLGPIAEYSDLRIRLMRPASYLGAACMALFLLSFSPATLWIGGTAVVLMRVANRVAGLMYSALLRDTTTVMPLPSRSAKKGDPDPVPVASDDAAHELAARGTAVGYVGMLIYAIVAAILFIGPSMFLINKKKSKDDTAINGTLALINGTTPAGTNNGVDLGSSFWMEQLLPIVGVGLFWGLGAWLVTFPHLKVSTPGPSFPNWVARGSKCGPRPDSCVGDYCGCCCSADSLRRETIQQSRTRRRSTTSPRILEAKAGEQMPPTSAATPSPTPPSAHVTSPCSWFGRGLRALRFGAAVGVTDQLVAWTTVVQLPNRDLLWYLISWMFLSDAASTATSSAALLVADELDVSTVELAAIAVLGMIAAAAGSMGWKRLVETKALSPQGALHVAILILTSVLVWVIFMAQRWELYVLTLIAGLQLGAISSFTRSLLITMTPSQEQTRIASLYELTQKGTSWIGPLAIGSATEVYGDKAYRLIVVVTVFVEIAIGWPLFFFLVNSQRGANAAKAFDAARAAEASRLELTATVVKPAKPSKTGIMFIESPLSRPPPVSGDSKASAIS
jgi:MFS-type transporter involved in bile tolerance (Atg22 family)